MPEGGTRLTLHQIDVVLDECAATPRAALHANVRRCTPVCTMRTIQDLGSPKSAAIQGGAWPDRCTLEQECAKRASTMSSMFFKREGIVRSAEVAVVKE